MSLRRKILSLAVISAVPLVLLAADQSAEKKPATVSVAEFAKMLAATSGNGRAPDARAAADALAARGVSLKDVSAPLSERTLAQILDAYGVRVKPTDSARAVSPARAEAALLLIGGALSTGRGSSEVGASVAPAPQTIEDCVTLPNHGQCVNCCKDLGLAANSCARTCQVINKPSPSEPLP
jgi:hypothetical protein